MSVWVFDHVFRVWPPQQAAPPGSGAAPPSSLRATAPTAAPGGAVFEKMAPILPSENSIAASRGWQVGAKTAPLNGGPFESPAVDKCEETLRDLMSEMHRSDEHSEGAASFQRGGQGHETLPDCRSSYATLPHTIEAGFSQYLPSKVHEIEARPRQATMPSPWFRDASRACWSWACFHGQEYYQQQEGPYCACPTSVTSTTTCGHP